MNKSTPFERFLLFICVVIVPLDYAIPILEERSSGYLVLLFIFLYALVCKFNNLIRMAIKPPFLAAYLFLLIGFIMESVHPYADYTVLFRVAQMFIAAIAIASLCSDKDAIRAMLYGFLFISVCLSLFLFRYAYGDIRYSAATDFLQASAVRGAVFSDVSYLGNLNELSFHISKGAIIALSAWLTSPTGVGMLIYLLLSVICLIGTSLPMSRGGLIATVVTGILITFLFKIRKSRKFMVISSILVTILMLVPAAILSRFRLQTGEDPSTKEETRLVVYQAAATHLPEYLISGVGAGNFWEAWGLQSDYYLVSHSSVAGAHNCFIQITLYWGILGLLSYLLIFLLAFRCLPRPGEANDFVSISVFAIGISTFLMAMVMHVIYSKAFAFSFGLLAGYRYLVSTRES